MHYIGPMFTVSDSVMIAIAACACLVSNILLFLQSRGLHRETVRLWQIQFAMRELLERHGADLPPP